MFAIALVLMSIVFASAAAAWLNDAAVAWWACRDRNRSLAGEVAVRAARRVRGVQESGVVRSRAFARAGLGTRIHPSGVFDVRGEVQRTLVPR